MVFFVIYSHQDDSTTIQGDCWDFKEQAWLKDLQGDSFRLYTLFHMHPVQQSKRRMYRGVFVSGGHNDITPHPAMKMLEATSRNSTRTDCFETYIYELKNNNGLKVMPSRWVKRNCIQLRTCGLWYKLLVRPF